MNQFHLTFHWAAEWSTTIDRLVIDPLDMDDCRYHANDDDRAVAAAGIENHRRIVVHIYLEPIRIYCVHLWLLSRPQHRRPYYWSW